MEGEEADQLWGVSGGVPTGTTVALKDGWDPLGNGTTWQINSIGWVDGDGRNYLLAVLTNGDDSESYGIQTIEGVSAIVWNACARRQPLRSRELPPADYSARCRSVSGDLVVMPAPRARGRSAPTLSGDRPLMSIGPSTRRVASPWTALRAAIATSSLKPCADLLAPQPARTG